MKLEDQVNVPDTAYSEQQAMDYDRDRFVSKSGIAIHSAEFGCLRRSLSKVSKSSQVLEVGCGTGRLLVDLSDDGYSVDGVDGSKPMLAELKSKLEEKNINAELVLCEAAELSIPNDKYGFVYSIRLLNQTESPSYAKRVIGEMVRVTKPGGYCLIEFVNEVRPRIGQNKKVTTRLRPNEVLNAAKNAGADRVYWDGAFFLSMQLYHIVPKFLVGAIAKLDRMCSFVFPQLCSRTYLLVCKGCEE